MLLMGVLLDGQPVPVALYTGLDDDELEVLPTRAGPVILLPAIVFLDEAPPEFLIHLLTGQPGTRPEPGCCLLDRPQRPRLHTV